MLDSIEVVLQIDAPRVRLWAALSQAAHLERWQADQAKGALERGRFRLAWPALGVETELVVEGRVFYFKDYELTVNVPDLPVLGDPGDIRIVTFEPVVVNVLGGIAIRF